MILFPLSTLLLALTHPLTTTAAATTNHLHSIQPPSDDGPLGNGTALRIMPLGASITYGTDSTDGNGYRARLRSALTARGNAVNMVGSRAAGDMVDHDVEGWPGLRIGQVHDKAMVAVSVPLWKPNVVLVNAGTNDATQGWAVEAAGERMERMLRDVWAVSPRAVVVLSTLLVNLVVEAERNVLVINRQYGELARRLRAEGRRVVLADMHGPDGPLPGDMDDDTHPNDVGYGKMAGVWFRALEEASEAGWLQAPESVLGIPDDGEA